MPTFPVVDDWLKDQEFNALPYDVKKQKIEAYFDAYHADPEFRALPPGRQSEIRQRIVAAHIGQTPAPPVSTVDQEPSAPSVGRKFADAPGALVRGWTQGSLEIPRSLGIAQEYLGNRIASTPEGWMEDPHHAFKMMNDLTKKRVADKINAEGLPFANAVRSVLKEDVKARKEMGETIAFGGRAVQKYYGDLQKDYQPPADIANKNVVDNPELLLDPRWWAYGSGNMGPSLVMTLLPAGAVRQTTVRVGGLIVPKDPASMARLSKLANIMGAAAGGVAGGGMEAAQTYETVLKETGDEKQAARAAEFMGVFSGGLNSIGSMAFLESLGKGLISRGLIQGVIEGATEGLEEPAEVGAKALAKLISDGTLPQDMGEQFKQAFKEALTVAPIAGLTGVGGGVYSHFNETNILKNQERQQKADQVLNEILGDTADGRPDTPDIKTANAGPKAQAVAPGTVSAPVEKDPRQAALEREWERYEREEAPKIDLVAAAAQSNQRKIDEIYGRQSVLPSAQQRKANQRAAGFAPSRYVEQPPAPAQPWPSALAGPVEDINQQDYTVAPYAGPPNGPVFATEGNGGIDTAGQQMAAPEASGEAREQYSGLMGMGPGFTLMDRQAAGEQLQADYALQAPGSDLAAGSFSRQAENEPQTGLPVTDAPQTRIDQAANEAATSPVNQAPEPTEAQIAAGNYKKGHVKVHGLDISIENPRGSSRKGIDDHGKPWQTQMVHHYGYIRRTEGKDGDQVDVFVGPDPESSKVFVVDQVNPATGKFDEHKVMLGFDSRQTAIQGYLDNYEQGWQGLGSVTGTDIGRFKAWLKAGDSRRPFASSMGEGVERRSGTDAERDRRKDVARRKRVGDMTLDDLRAALLTSDKTGLPNRRAYDEAAGRRTRQASVDIDSLKWVNDNLGHEAGDLLIHAIGSALAHAGIDVYHVSGDEFIAEADAEEDIDAGMQRAYAFLQENKIEITDPATGGTLIFKGGFTYATGQDYEEADIKLKARKQERTLRGERAPRGGEPPGVVRKLPAGYQSQDRGRAVRNFQDRKQPDQQKADLKPPSKKEKALAQYQAFVHSLTDAQRETVAHLIEENPAAPSGLLLKIKKALKDAAAKQSDKKIVKSNAPDVVEFETYSLETGKRATIRVPKHPKGVNPLKQQSKRDYIGLNHKGRQVYQDENGNRMVAQDGFLVEAPVEVIAGASVNAGIKSASKLYDAGLQEYLTREELASFTADRRTSNEKKTSPDSRKVEDIVGTPDEEIEAVLDEVFGPREKPNTKTGQLAKEVGIEAVAGVKAAVKGLSELFSPKNRLSSGLTFDEQTYAKARPHFENAMAHAIKAGHTLMDLAKHLHNIFGDQIRPYLERFLKDKAAGKGLTQGQSNTTMGPSKEGKTNVNIRFSRKVEDLQAGGRGDRKSARISNVAAASLVDDGRASGIPSGFVSKQQRVSETETEKSGSERDSAARVISGSGDNGRGSDSGDYQRDDKPAAGKDVRRSGNLRPVDRRAAGDDSRLERQPLSAEDRNHVIGPDDDIVPSGVEGKINANIKAIGLVKQLVEQKRNPSPDEKKVLACYVGWGAFAQKVFDRKYDAYLKKHKETKPENYFGSKDLEKYNAWLKHYGKKLHPALGGLLTEDEWEAAAESTLNAHYTSREVIGAMWDLVAQLGFKGGHITEPAAGVGHFLGLMPEKTARRSHINAVELDKITSQILEKLYPQARVQNAGFENAAGLPDNSQDLIISNFPFGKYPVHDPKRPQYKTWSIHNYFFGRSLDAVRPGGLVAAVTSRYTLDAKRGGKIREALNHKADLIGAIRLPYTAFKGNAGTEVVTDILVFRKKDGKSHGLGHDLRVSSSIEIGKERVDINEYFIKHPEMVLGKHSLKGSMYSANEYTVEGTGDLAAQLSEAVKRFPAVVTPTGKAWAPAQAHKVRYAALSHREGALVQKDGQVWFVEDGRLKPPAWINSRGKAIDVMADKAKARRVTDYMAVKSAVSALIDRMGQDDAMDAELAKLRQELNAAYDHFVKRNREIGQPANSFIRAMDIEFPMVDALEVEVLAPANSTIKSGSNNGQARNRGKMSFAKSDIFFKRTIFPFKEPHSADSVADALALSRLYRNTVDLDYIADLTGMDADKARAELIASEMVYVDPATGLLEPPDAYLSGNVRVKLNTARKFATDDHSLERNVKALERVQPDPLDIEFIYFRLSTPWVPAQMVQDFLKETMGVTASVELSRTDESTSWGVSARNGQSGAPNTQTWGTERRKGHELVQDCLNLKRTVVHDHFMEDGKQRSVKNQEQTEAAIEKQADIQAEFSRWGKGHKHWGPKLTDIYNEQVNGFVLRKFPVPNIDHFPGASKAISLRPLQKRFVCRGLQESTLFAYGVGTGKTFSFISLAMEMRRVGTAKKPCIVVQNSTVGQFGKAFNALYSGARVLIPNDKQRMQRNRQRLLTQIATGDWDAIVLPHSFFDGIGDDPQREAAFVEEQLDMIEEAIEEFEAAEGSDSFTVKDLKALRKRKEARLRSLLQRRKDSAVYFEKLGIDALLIDEAHAYKRSEFFTKMGAVKGIDQGSSQRSTSLMLKADYIRQKTGGKNVILATGTPISNTTAELWTMIRYVRPDLLKEYGVTLFDDFAGTFGETTISLEETESGTYKEVERFNRYVNGHQLLTMFHTAADVQLTQDAGLNLPQVQGGKPESVIVPRSKALSELIDELRDTREYWEGLSGREKRRYRNIPLLLFGVAKKAAIDLRLVDSDVYGDDPDNKLSTVAKKVADIWTQTKADRSTQAIFLDSYRDSTGRFNAYHELRKKLVSHGVPADEIALVSDANNDAQREAMFQRVRQGQARVIIGSTQKLGIGVNIQDKLIAAHHVDAPPRPMDIEQRNGRIVREGNENPVVQIYNYGTQATLDSVMYDRLVKKQRFIDQMLTGDIEGHSFEDPLSEEQLSLAEQNAAFSGNPLVFEKSAAEAAVKKLHRSKSRHERSVSAARRNVRDLEAAIESGQRALDKAKAKRALIDRLAPGLEFSSFECDGKDLCRKDLNKLIAGQWDNYAKQIASRYGKITYGQYLERDNGRADAHVTAFKINAMDCRLELTPSLEWGLRPAGDSKPRAFNGIDGRLYASHGGKMIISPFINSAAGMLRTFKNRLEDTRSNVDQVAADIEKAEADLTENQRLAKETFAQDKELEKAEARLEDIEARLLALERERPARGDERQARSRILDRLISSVDIEDQTTPPAGGMVSDNVRRYYGPRQIEQGDNDAADLRFGPSRRPDFEGQKIKGYSPPALIAHQRLRVSTTGGLRGAGHVVRDVDEAASLLAPIRKSAQEIVYTIAVDKHGSVLEIHKYSKGSAVASMANVFEIAGRALNIHGVETLYIAHNHPSGQTSPSPDDIGISNALATALDLGDVKARAFIIGGTQFQEIDLGADFIADGPKSIGAIKRPVALPVKERFFAKHTSFGALSKNRDAIQYLHEQRLVHTDGFLLVDINKAPVGFLALKSGSTWKEITRNLVAASEILGAQGVIFNNATRMLEDGHNNRLNYLRRFQIAGFADLGLLDVIDHGESMSDMGTFRTFFQKATPKQDERTAKLQVLNTAGKYFFSNRPGTAGAVSIDDIRSVFKGQDVFIDKDGGGFHVRLKNGRALQVRQVAQITPDMVQFKVAYGDQEPEVLSGGYSKGTISLSEHFADKWTLAHEMVHALEDMGMLNAIDVNVLRVHIKKLAEKGMFDSVNPTDVGGVEDRARFVEDQLKRRSEVQGPLGRVLKKLGDFFSKLAAMLKKNARSLLADIETGRVFENQAGPAQGIDAYQNLTFSDILSRDLPEGVIERTLKDLGKRERFTRPPAWIAKKFPAFKLLFDRQQQRDKDRTKRLAASLEEVETFLKLDGEHLDTLRSLIWTMEHRKVKALEGLNRFNKNSDGDYVLNDKYYDQYADYLNGKQLAVPVVDAFMALRKSLDRDLAEVLNMMASMDDIDQGVIDEYRQQMGSIHNYFPHMRYGTHFIQVAQDVTYQDPKTGGQVTEKQVVYREHFNAPLRAIANAKARQIKERFADAQVTVGKVEKLPEDVFAVPIPTEAIEAVMNAAVARVADRQVQQAFEEMLPKALADALRSRGWGAHMIKRKGIPGHETEDIKRVLFDYKAGLYGWMTKIQASRDMGRTMGQVQAHKQQNLWAAMRQYVYDMMANATWADQVLNNMRALFFAKYLGGNLKTALLNLTQNIIAGWPRLGMDVGGAAGMMLKSSGGAIVAAVTKNKKLAQDEQRLLRELMEEGVTDSNFINEMRGMVGQNVYSMSNKVMRVLGLPMALAESLNRSTMALAAYRAAVNGKISRQAVLDELGLKKGQKAAFEQAKQYAETLVNDAHFVYGKANRPEAFRGPVGKLVSLAYTFRTFSHNLINLWSWMWRQGGPGKRAVLKSMGAMAVIGGLSSIPLYKTLMHVLREMTGDDWEDKAVDALIPDDAPLLRDMIIYGLPAGAGVTLGGSIGMELPVFDKLKFSQSLSDQLGSGIGEILGVPWAIVEDLEASINSYQSGQKLRALEYLLPTVAANPFKAVRLRNQGQTAISGRAISDPGSNSPRKLSFAEALGKAAGFQPVSSTKAWDLHQALESFQEYKQDKQREFANRIFNALRNGDLTTVNNIGSEVVKWNADQRSKGRPYFMISNDDLLNALRARSRSGQPPKYLWGKTGQMMKKRGMAGHR